MDASQRCQRRVRMRVDAETAVNEACKRLVAEMESTPEEAVHLLGMWTAALSEAGAWGWLAGKAALMGPAVTAAADSSASNEARRYANTQLSAVVDVLPILLTQVLSPVLRLQTQAATPPGPQRSQALLQASAPLWESGFMDAIASALQASTKCARLLTEPAAQRALGMDASQAANRRLRCAVVVEACAKHICIGYQALSDFHMGNTYAQELPSLTEAAASLLQALTGSGLLAAAAGAIMRGPGSNDLEVTDKNAVGYGAVMYSSASSCALALHSAQAVLSCADGAAAAALAAALSHPDILALEEALVEQLCVHGGVELPDRGADDVGQARWLPALEAECFRLLSTGPGQLEHLHSTTVSVLVYALYPPMRTPSAPRPAALARLSALEPRALEALSRLCRGQGLEGSYKQGPSFFHFTAWLLDGILANTHRAESAAWCLDLAVQGTKAALESGQATKVCMQSALQALRLLAKDEACPPERLGAPSREELAEQLSRAGLAANLDHALRLAFTAADRAAVAPDNDELGKLALGTAAVPVLVSQVLGSLALPLAARYAPGGGVMVTFAKRAAMITTRLRELEEAGTAEARAKERELLLAAIHQFVPSLYPCARVAKEEVWPDAEGAAVAGSGSDSSGGNDCGDGGASDADVAAFVARSLCHLATQVAARSACRRVGPQTYRSVLYVTSMALGSLALCRPSQPTDPQTIAHRILACQPHRLLAAACKLYVKLQPPSAATAAPSGAGAGPAAELDQLQDVRYEMVLAFVQALELLLEIPQLNARVLSWLSPPGHGTEPAAAASPAPAERMDTAERGCLEPLVRLGVAPVAPEFVLPLLSFYAGACSRGAASGAQSGAPASDMVDAPPTQSPNEGLGGRPDEAGPVPESAAAEQSGREGPGPGQDARAEDVAALLAAPLPPPLDVTLAEAALPGLRVCAYPGCLSYGGRSEADLPLKACGRCRCVRYCSPGCQAGHWRAGHKADCRAPGTGPHPT
ncbi:hypothetical protein HYH03_003016 [Edaphochlamys debaryana]|uniref:phytol kinase n=1 Tax=Edaphochlamys debaryana TaxID=47281 RepID=A0A836C4E5_9CHLO|nr:hypothetical protein HYH03_003016 [Edaphochlamys debaryana]|eukprot:KAG2498823.1 hypothetical protein HYH03_003016 [Edaphochlamys debaryana]